LWATELHAAFRKESRTSLLSTSAALLEIREAIGHFVVFSQGKPHLAIFNSSSNCETALGFASSPRGVSMDYRIIVPPQLP
jgi:hypothetical protein